MNNTSIKSGHILLFIILTISLVSAGMLRNDKIIISTSLSEYRQYLEGFPSLDRLFLEDETAFFLVNPDELAHIQTSGISWKKRHLPGTVSTYSDSPEILSANGVYHNTRESETFIRELSGRFPDLCRVLTIGESLEGRKLTALKISDFPYLDEGEPNIHIVGCHHAREWISVEIPLYFIRYLLENYASNPVVKRAIDGAQIYVLPVLNPDGLEFSIRTYRWWRKNRRYNGDMAWGVDLNRNYAYRWGIDNRGSSGNPWSATFRGSGPFSEPETLAYRNFLLNHPPAALISYHNFSQKILYPWGYTSELTPDEQKMNDIAAAMSALMEPVNGRYYKYGNAADAIYPTNGDLTDWVYGVFGVPAYTIELPAKSFREGAFFTSQDIVQEVFAENLPALLYFVDYFRTDDAPNPRTDSLPKEKHGSKTRVIILK